MDKIIIILLWLGEISDLIYLVLGAIMGLLVGNFIKIKVYRFKDSKGNTKEINKKMPNAFNILIFFVIVVFSFMLIIVNNNYTTIPDVIGLTYEEASAKLHTANLSCTENYGRYGDVVTDITPNLKYVRVGSMINLDLGRIETYDESDSETINDSNNQTIESYATTMPDVYMVQEEAALKYLNVAGFSNVEILPQYSDTTVAGYVLRSEPFAGEDLNFTDKITLYVSVNEVQ